MASGWITMDLSKTHYRLVDRQWQRSGVFESEL